MEILGTVTNTPLEGAVVFGFGAFGAMVPFHLVLKEHRHRILLLFVSFFGITVAMVGMAVGSTAPFVAGLAILFVAVIAALFILATEPLETKALRDRLPHALRVRRKGIAFLAGMAVLVLVGIGIGVLVGGSGDSSEAKTPPTVVEGKYHVSGTCANGSCTVNECARRAACGVRTRGACAKAPPSTSSARRRARGPGPQRSRVGDLGPARQQSLRQRPVRLRDRGGEVHLRLAAVHGVGVDVTATSGPRKAAALAVGVLACLALGLGTTGSARADGSGIRLWSNVTKADDSVAVRVSLGGFPNEQCAGEIHKGSEVVDAGTVATSANGGASWSWQIPGDVRGGAWEFTVTCSGGPTLHKAKTRFIASGGAGPAAKGLWVPGTLHRRSVDQPHSLEGNGGRGSLSYPTGQSTWWVAEHRPDLPFFPGRSGDAVNWAKAAAAKGFPVGRKPQVGAVAVFEPGQYGAGASATSRLSSP